MSAKEIYEKITENIETVMRGQSDAIRKLLAGFVSEGHVLLEDYPGTGKTTFAKSLALSMDARFTRIQFTPDLLPSDILGVSIFDQRKSGTSLNNPITTQRTKLFNYLRTFPFLHSIFLLTFFSQFNP